MRTKRAINPCGTLNNTIMVCTAHGGGLFALFCSFCGFTRLPTFVRQVRHFTSPCTPTMHRGTSALLFHRAAALEMHLHFEY